MTNMASVGAKALADEYETDAKHINPRTEPTDIAAYANAIRSLLTDFGNTCSVPAASREYIDGAKIMLTRMAEAAKETAERDKSERDNATHIAHFEALRETGKQP